MAETPALSDSRLKGVDHEVVRHDRVGSLEEAAALRGVGPAAVIKTMVVRRGEGDYVFVLVPGDRVIDWPKLRDHLGERRLSMPDADEALAASGYVRGTITPFGSTTQWPVVADERIGDAPVSIGGGDHGVSITMNGGDLLSVLPAQPGDVTKRQS
jgi:Cys-tRNA(Pro) deacylase